MARWQTTVAISKVDTDKHIVSGWASIAFTADGQQVVDSQGDVIDADDLETAAANYLLDARGVGSMHKQAGIGRPCSSIVFTPEVQKALGIAPGVLPVGWWLSIKVDDPDAWAGVKSGRYSGFSIGGSGNRQKVG